MNRDELFRLLRCPLDGGEFLSGSGKLQCRTCRYTAPIEDGIVSLLGPEDEEARRELAIREQEYRQELPRLRREDLLDMVPTMAALQLSGSEVVLELGAGSGRYTREIARSSAGVIAVDFSRRGLLQIARAGMDNVLPVQSDIARLGVAPNAFQRLLSTLTSNLPDRKPLYRLAAAAGGRFVFSTHHYGWNARFRGVEKTGRYAGSGIYRHFFTADELRNEAAAFFNHVEVRPIGAVLPGTGRLGLPVERFSGLLDRLPGVRHFGDLLLGVAERPLSPLPD